MNCVNTEGAFRIIQSIPSPKAEPFKKWLAKIGHERIQEIENPELAQDRIQEYYDLKDIQKTGLKKGFVESLSGRNSRMNGTSEELKKKETMQFLEMRYQKPLSGSLLMNIGI